MFAAFFTVKERTVNDENGDVIAWFQPGTSDQSEGLVRAAVERSGCSCRGAVDSQLDGRQNVFRIVG